MPLSNIDRLQTPLRNLFLEKLSANFRPLGKVGQVTKGQGAFRRAAFLRGIILIEANEKHIANHTVEVTAEPGTSWAASGGTPSSGSIATTEWDEVDYAATGTVTVTATATDAAGRRVVAVP